MSVMTRSMRKKVEEAAVQESTPSPKSINDVPPEVLEMILKKLDTGKNTILPYRQVHPKWKQIIDEHLEQRNLKGEQVVYSTFFIAKDGFMSYDANPKICIPKAIFRHPGNPFPSSSLMITTQQNWIIDRMLKLKGNSTICLDSFTTKLGSFLTTLVLDHMCLKFRALIQILKPLSNLKKFKMVHPYVAVLLEDDLNSFPVLSHLTTLELIDCTIVEEEETPQQEFCLKFINAYADQLVSLELGKYYNYIPLKQHRPSVENGPFQKLQILKVVPTGEFLRSSCVSPLLKSLSIVGDGATYIWGKIDSVNVNVLMSFVDKFSNTLESLELDVKWRELFDDACKQKTIQTGGILETAAVLFPKLTKLTLHYPTNDVEAAVIKKSFLPKFPALQQLHLFHVRLSLREEHEKVEKIMEFINREKYQSVSTKLNRVRFWFSGMGTDNYLVYSWEIPISK